MASAEFSDRDAIVEVVNRYSYSLDERDWPLLDQVFTADAVGSYGGPGGPPLEGREAIVASIRSFLDGCGPSQHLLGNHIVDVDGDEAASRCKVRVYHYGAGERAALTPYECFGVYRDRLCRTPDGWRIVERVFDVQHAVGDIAILQPDPGGPDDPRQGRRSHDRSASDRGRAQGIHSIPPGAIRPDRDHEPPSKLKDLP